jgi:hypothetical protein
MMKRAVLLVYFALQCFPAKAGYVSYSEISTYSRHSQIMYVSGAVDGIAALNNHLNHCLAEELKMKASQIATNILNFAATRPALYSLNMSQVVVVYLNEACPLPKPQ